MSELELGTRDFVPALSRRRDPSLALLDPLCGCARGAVRPTGKAGSGYRWSGSVMLELGLGASRIVEASSQAFLAAGGIRRLAAPRPALQIAPRPAGGLSGADPSRVCSHRDLPAWWAT